MCGEQLKNVLTQSDVDAVLAEMGPVAAEGEPTATEGDTKVSSDAAPAPKRLYRIHQGAWIAGVCNGLAAYFNIDVSLVRLLYILVTVITHGLGILVYVIMIVVVPVARTPKEYEEASGIPPITAQKLVDRARKEFEDFTNSNEWKSWKGSLHAGLTASHDAHRAWKQQRKAWKRAQKQAWKYYRYEHRRSFLSELGGFFWSMFSLFVMLFVVWYLYHHVHAIREFIDFLRWLWDSFIYNLSYLLNNKLS